METSIQTSDDLLHLLKAVGKEQEDCGREFKELD